MMDAAFLATQQVHWSLSQLIETCQMNIWTGSSFIPHRAKILSNADITFEAANIILIPIESWIRAGSTRLREISYAIETLGAMILAQEAALGNGVVGADYETALAVRNASLPTGGHNTQAADNEHFQRNNRSFNQSTGMQNLPHVGV